MPQQIKVPGVGVLQFPDGMSDADISAAIQKNFPDLKPANAADDMSAGERFTAGVGESMLHTGQGVKQIAMHIGNHLGLVSDQSVQQYQQQLANQRQTDTALNATTAGKVGQFAGDAAMMAAAPEGYLGAAGAGAALAGAQPTVGDESHLQNAAVGGVAGAAGQAAGAVLGRVVQPIRNALDPTRQAAVDTLKSAGIPLDLAQATGSKVATTLKNAAHDSPFSDSHFSVDQQKAFNGAVLRTIGENANEASPAVMDAAKRRIGAVFDQVAANTTVKVDQKLLTDITHLHSSVMQEMSPAEYAPIHAQIDNIISKAAANNGSIDGQAYANIKTSLDRMSGSTVSATGAAARDLRSSLDDALQRSASPQDLQALTQARAQYRALKQIEPAVDAKSDDISYNGLYNSIDTKKNAAQTVYGRGDQTLVSLAQAAKTVLGKGTANSGTPQRIAGLATLGGAGAAVYDLATGQHIDSGHMVEAAIAGGLAPQVARKLVESQAGRQWIARWARSKAAGLGVQGLQRLGAVSGGAAAPQLNQQMSPQGPAPQQDPSSPTGPLGQ